MKKPGHNERSESQAIDLINETIESVSTLGPGQYDRYCFAEFDRMCAKSFRRRDMTMLGVACAAYLDNHLDNSKLKRSELDVWTHDIAKGRQSSEDESTDSQDIGSQKLGKDSSGKEQKKNPLAEIFKKREF